MRYISNQEIEQALTYSTLIEALREAFQAPIVAPLRHHHTIANPKAAQATTLLVMPAWQVGHYLGIKLVTVAPDNARQNLPSIQGNYVLMNATTGTPLAYFDAALLTAYRTACASALASSFLSRKDSDSLLMIGTGTLAPHLIRAHAQVRPIKQVYVWGRTFSKAETLAKKLKNDFFRIEAVRSIAKILPKVAIVSCATLSATPLIEGKYIQKGQHIDLVGAYKPSMRESDDETIQKASIFVDTREGATTEAGDIVIPIQKGILKTSDIVADLFDLCQQKKHARPLDESITVFKSVGHALEDLAAARLVYEQF